MSKIYLTIILTAIFLLSCTSSKENNPQYATSLVESQKIIFPIDENTYYLSKSIFQFEEDGKEYLFFGNFEKKQHEILIYDIKTQNLHKRIPLKREGPNGLPAILGCRPYFDSKTFLVSQHNIGKTSVIDGEGNVIRHYNLRQANDKKGFLIDGRHGISYFYMPSFTKDSVIHFSNGFFRQYMIGQHLDRDNWKIIPMFYSLNLKNGQVGTLPIKYPDIFEDDVKIPAGGGYNFTYDYNYKKGRLVCSLTGYDSIMVTDDLKHVRWYNGKSRYLESIRPRVYDANGFDWLRESKGGTKYHNIMYDKYRDVYYRIAEFPYEFKQNESPFDDPKGREFSIIIFDKDLNIIGETKFPGNKYLYKMSFVGRDGLYISENNLANPNFDENKLVFACFSLIDNKKR